MCSVERTTSLFAPVLVARTVRVHSLFVHYLKLRNKSQSCVTGNLCLCSDIERSDILIRHIYRNYRWLLRGKDLLHPGNASQRDVFYQ